MSNVQRGVTATGEWQLVNFAISSSQHRNDLMIDYVLVSEYTLFQITIENRIINPFLCVIEVQFFKVTTTPTPAPRAIPVAPGQL
jgi:hypothetical protein